MKLDVGKIVSSRILTILKNIGCKSTAIPFVKIQSKASLRIASEYVILKLNGLRK